MNEHSGVGRTWAECFLLLSVVGMAASIALVKAELSHLKNPDVALACDINPLVGCGKSLMSPAAHLLGVPNALVGTAIFAFAVAVALLLAMDVALPKVAWFLGAAGGIVGLGAVAFFLYQSIVVFGALCPYCLVVWVVAIAMAWMLIGKAARLCNPDGAVGSFLSAYPWAPTVLTYLVGAVVVVLAMADQIALVL